ncbi:MAG TPA: NUDIX domain-containing protein [Pyrinomonadaceae bacterium]|nr:NUDIX domain-containing protein [Pyrinomonadaceae bacterium]
MSNHSFIAKELVFGSRSPNVEYIERRAAYVVIIDRGQVAMVGHGRNRFLPGGGSLPDETPEMTVAREVREEIGFSVRLLHLLGKATQYFYADSDVRHYEMLATFFAGQISKRISNSIPEHELEWLPLSEATASCFHECHAWAIGQCRGVPQQEVGREPR